MIRRNAHQRNTSDVVAVIPAAGRAARIAPLPCSKEVLPLGVGIIPGHHGPRPKVASHYLVECMASAGIRKAYWVIRQGKWDIPSYWNDGSTFGMHFAYIVIGGSKGPPDTIDKAYAFTQNHVIAFGFPDILFRPRDVFVQLLKRLHIGSADVVLGLFPAHDVRKMDMVDIGPGGRIRAIQLKPKRSVLTYAWLCAVWTPVFTDYLHEFLRSGKTRTGLTDNRRIDPQGDVPVGVVIREAIKAGVSVEGVTFKNGRYLDIGTPDGIEKASKFTF